MANKQKLFNSCMVWWTCSPSPREGECQAGVAQGDASSLRSRMLFEGSMTWKSLLELAGSGLQLSQHLLLLFVVHFCELQKLLPYHLKPMCEPTFYEAASKVIPTEAIVMDLPECYQNVMSLLYLFNQSVCAKCPCDTLLYVRASTFENTDSSLLSWTRLWVLLLSARLFSAQSKAWTLEALHLSLNGIKMIHLLNFCMHCKVLQHVMEYNCHELFLS